MDIIIHGTKDGYRQLFSTNSDLAYEIAKDMRIGSNEDKSLGQSAYASFYINRKCIYKIYHS